jgi:hypothetical protein
MAANLDLLLEVVSLGWFIFLYVHLACKDKGTDEVIFLQS